MTEAPVSAFPDSAGASPAMAQWFALKARQPDALLFFRMGDFYELFFADAHAAAGALDIALTARGTHAGQPISMCGVPVAAAQPYLARLIRRGFRVAIAEQTEPPRKPGATAKGPLSRDIVRLVTAGTLTEDELLEAGRSNLLLALSRLPGSRPRDPEQVGAAWIDISTGLFETEAPTTSQALSELLARLDPAEILAPAGLFLGDMEARRGPEPVPHAPLAARARLVEPFGAASLDAFGDFTDAEAVAGLAVLDYVRDSQAGRLPRLSRPVPQGDRLLLGIDPATRNSLELLRGRDGGTDHTLFGTVNRTVTAPGSRMLAGWVAAPLATRAPIAARQDAWRFLLAETGPVAQLRQILRGAPDIARALGRLSVGRGQPRDLAAIRDGLAAAHAAATLFRPKTLSPPFVGPLPPLLERAVRTLDLAAGLEALLRSALAADLPAKLEDGGAVADGFDGELDAERRLRDDSRKVIAGKQLDYAQLFGVASLRIKHHAQLGYVIEAPVSASNVLRNNPALVLRQGTASVSRFTTAELSELDRRIAEAGARTARRERIVFDSLVARALGTEALPAIAEALALLDVVQSAASLASDGRWCRPEMTEDATFHLQALRHPVVEAALSRTDRFTPNDCDLSSGRRVMLLTGPNMAGKSTFLRQAALAVVLAQAGLPVPAERATVGLVDRLFSRVGASDDLARGRSTFMVEMTETASILNLAGPRSLVVVDEIGRGTSTLDGLAIAWAVLESLHGAQRCRTIFATHFHELGELAETLPDLCPHTMSVREWRNQVVFRHEVLPGVAGRSWGVHVAKLAGVPETVVRRAGRLLSSLEKNRGGTAARLPLFASLDEQPSVGPREDTPPDPLAEALAALDPDRMTPREALDALYGLRAIFVALQDDAVATGTDALRSSSNA